MLFNQGMEISERLLSDDLQVVMLPERVRYSLRLKKGDVAAAEKISGLKLARKIGGSHIKAEHSIMCLGPDEWLIVAKPKAAAPLKKALAKIEASFICSVVDISHRNVRFSISGAQCENAVNLGCPLDLSLGSFPVGKATRTVFENAPIILIRTGQAQFELECWRSYGSYVTGFMERFAADLAAQ